MIPESERGRAYLGSSFGHAFLSGRRVGKHGFDGVSPYQGLPEPQRPGYKNKVSLDGTHKHRATKAHSSFPTDSLHRSVSGPFSSTTR